MFAISLLIALLLTTFLSFFQVHHQVRHDHEKQLKSLNQLLANSAQLLLQETEEQAINSLFSAVQHKAIFPIYAITLLDSEQAVLNSTGLESLIEQPEAAWFGSDHQLYHLHHDRVLSSQPLMLSDEPIEWGYLLIKAGSAEFPWNLWLWQMVIWLMMPCLLLFALWLATHKQKNFLLLGMDDIKQLALNWLDGYQDGRLAQQHPLSPVYNQFLQRIHQQQQDLETERTTLQEQLNQLQQQLQQYDSAQTTQVVQLQRAQQHLIEQKQQCTELFTQLAHTPDQTLRQVMADCVALKKRQNEPASLSSLRLPDWIATQMPSWRDCIKDQQQLQVFEDLQAADFSLSLIEADLALCCQAMIRLCSERTKQSQLALHWQLKPELGQLDFTLLLKGEPLAEHICQLLQSTSDVMTTDAPIDVYFIQQACQRLNAKLSISCLHELGGSFLFECPVQLSSHSPPNRFEHLYCFKYKATIEPAVVHNLKGLTHQLHTIQEWQELPSVACRAAAPLVVVVPPMIMDRDLSQWHELVTQPHVVMLYSKKEQHVWQGIFPGPKLALPVSGQEVMQQLSITPQPNDRRFSLLIVDDNETNQAFLQAVLAPYPFIVAAEVTGQGAIDRCARQQFDLILMDIQLPDMSGIDVTQQLRKQPELMQTTILAFTAHALEEEIEQFKQAGMNDVVIKPLDSNKVATLLRWCQQPFGESLL